MKSFAIKVSSDKLKDELISEFEEINLKDFYLSFAEFKKFKNVIVHYSGSEVISFMDLVSEAIASVIQKEYDRYFLNRIVLRNYFYMMRRRPRDDKENCK